MSKTRTNLVAPMIIIVVGAIASTAWPVEPAPQVVQDGFRALKEQGPDKALEIWIKGSPIQDDPNAKSQSAFLQQIINLYGSFEGYEVVRTCRLGSRSKMVYVASHFQKGDVFARFLLYQTGDSWILSIFQFHTNPDVVWPSSLMTTD